MDLVRYIQGVPGGKANILGGPSIGYSKKKVHTCVRTCVRGRAMHHIARKEERQDTLRRETRHVLTRVAKCTDVDGGIFENILYWVNCTNYVISTINTGIRNIT
jgi:hypothetical protein